MPLIRNLWHDQENMSQPIQHAGLTYLYTQEAQVAETTTVEGGADVMKIENLSEAQEQDLLEEIYRELNAFFYTDGSRDFDY